MLLQQLANGLSLGAVYALYALGFTLVFGVLGVINLSHGAVFMVGAYAAHAVMVQTQGSLTAGIIAAFLSAGALGLAIDYLVLKPLRTRNAPHLIPMIATIGVAIVVNSAAQGIFGAETKRFPVEAFPDATIEMGAVSFSALEVAIVVLSAALMCVLLLGLRRTQTGRALRAIAESPRAAYLLGIDVERLFHLTSLIAAALGGVAGVLIGLYSNAIYPLMGQPILHKGIAVIILGGMGDIRGALLGGLFLGFAEVLSVAYIGSNMRDAVAFGLLFLVLLLRPRGIFGSPQERKA